MCRAACRKSDIALRCSGLPSNDYRNLTPSVPSLPWKGCALPCSASLLMAWRSSAGSSPWNSVGKGDDREHGRRVRAKGLA